MQGRTELEITAEIQEVPYGDLVLELFYQNIKPDSIQVVKDLIFAQTNFTPEQQREPCLIATLGMKRFLHGNGTVLTYYQAASTADLLRMMELDYLIRVCATIYAGPQSTGIWSAGGGNQYGYGLGISLQLAKETFMSIGLGSNKGEGYIWILERCIEASQLFNGRNLVIAPLIPPV